MIPPIRQLNRLVARMPAWPLYALAPAIIGYHFWLALNGMSGPNPVNTLERDLGRAALQLLLLTLALTPLRRLFGINLLRFRRALGLSAFFVALAHLLAWAVIDVASFSRIFADIARRPYITIGMAAFLAMVPLALTSTQSAMRRLGAKRWRRLHRLVYAIALLAVVHFIMVRKGWQPEPLMYLFILLLLLAARLPFPPIFSGEAGERAKKSA